MKAPTHITQEVELGPCPACKQPIKAAATMTVTITADTGQLVPAPVASTKSAHLRLTGSLRTLDIAHDCSGRQVNEPAP